MYKPKYFTAEELVSKSLFTAYANRQDYLYWQFNTDVLKTCDLLREAFGPMTINNWSMGGSFQNRGLRTDDSVGAMLSAHKRGAAIDCHWRDITAQEVRDKMKELGCFNAGWLHKEEYTKEEEPFRYIRRIECTSGGTPISWFHFDIFNTFNEDGSIIQLHV